MGHRANAPEVVRARRQHRSCLAGQQPSRTILSSVEPVFPACAPGLAASGLAESALGHSNVCPVASRGSRPEPAERETLTKTKYALSDRTDGFEADYDRCDSKPGASKRAVAVRAHRVRRGVVVRSICRTPATRTPFGALSR